jgi:CO/xanthine dehydrogenase Mo-binding subunit
MPKKTFNIIGKPVIREDGYEKVSGSARFADDINFPGQLYGIMVRLPVTHAEISEIDYSPVKNNEAIEAICDASDVPGTNKIGIVRWDQPVFCSEKIVTRGDVVAMLLGDSEHQLQRLRARIKCHYQQLPLITDPQKALDPGAPLIHPELKSNLIVHHPLRKGNIDQGFTKSDHILEQTYTTSAVEHAYLETETVLARPLEGNRGIHIVGSIQNPFTTRRLVASVLDWPLTKVQVEQATLGGSFGGKDDLMNSLAARAAIGALKTGRPVKIRYGREDSIMESYKRHPYIMHYKVGFKNDGHIMAMKIDILADGGAYASTSPFVTWRTVVQATGPYRIDNVETDVRAVYTNNPYTGAMRGFGSPQPIFAQESLLDEIAQQLNMSPVEIRRINGLRQGSVTATGQSLKNHDVNLIPVLNKAVKQSHFIKKWDKFSQKRKIRGISISPDLNSGILKSSDFIENEEQYSRGIGLALSLRGCSLGAEGIDAAAAYLSVQPDGSAYLLSGLAENGQGLRTTYSMIAAEVLGMNIEQIHYLDYHTRSVPDSGPTVASRSTLMGGGAVMDAAQQVRKRLENYLRQYWKLDIKTSLVFSRNQVIVPGKKQFKITVPKLCQAAYSQGINLAAMGWYMGPKVEWDESSGQGPAYFTYVYGCQVAEITVNMSTGEVYVDRVTAVHDPGTVINLLGARGQIYGGVTQGAGYGLWEQISTHQGEIRELNFDQYLIPTSKDIGVIVPIFLEGKEKYGPWGAKSLGEPTLELTAAAISNAIKNATGQRFFNLPLNLEELLLQRKLHPEDLSRGSEK